MPSKRSEVETDPAILAKVEKQREALKNIPQDEYQGEFLILTVKRQPGRFSALRHEEQSVRVKVKHGMCTADKGRWSYFECDCSVPLNTTIFFDVVSYSIRIHLRWQRQQDKLIVPRDSAELASSETPSAASYE
eukprot:1184780-Prorocentrum_minimum.AAC.1